jgi:hypothetical protein
LAGVRNVDTPDQATSSKALCPVCGMETTDHGGPQIYMQHGDQIIHTCSSYHAHQVYEDILTYADTSKNQHAKLSSDNFCTGTGTTMLNGFSWSSSSACILLWFPGWILDTPLIYVSACIAVAFLAIFNEYLLRLRRVLRKESSRRKLIRALSASGIANVTSNSTPTANETTYLLHSVSGQLAATTSGTIPSNGWYLTSYRALKPETQHLVHCFLHGGTIFIAYMLMLVAMTYDASLFGCTILGYIVGHFFFGERRDSIPDIAQTSFPS